MGCNPSSGPHIGDDVDPGLAAPRTVGLDPVFDDLEPGPGQGRLDLTGLVVTKENATVVFCHHPALACATLQGQVQDTAGTAQQAARLGQSGGKLAPPEVEQRGAGPDTVKTACDEWRETHIGQNEGHARQAEPGLGQHAVGPVQAGDATAEPAQKVEVATRPATQIQDTPPAGRLGKKTTGKSIQGVLQAQVAPSGRKIARDPVITGNCVRNLGRIASGALGI